MSDIKVFNFAVRAEPTGSLSTRNNKANMGDGYSVSSPDGINTELQSWSITCTSSRYACDGSDGFAWLAFQFLREQAIKAESFNWTTPLGDLIRVEPSALAPKKAGATFSVSTTFTRVYR